MDKTLFTNALLVTPDGVKKGELLTEDGIIRDISDGGAQGASGAELIDLKGDYLIPGIIELHTRQSGMCRRECQTVFPEYSK